MAKNKECDNKSLAHGLSVIGEDRNAMRVFCNVCHRRYVIHKDPNKGNPEKRIYAKLFKRWILQGNDNLFYKYHPEHIKK